MDAWPGETPEAPARATPLAFVFASVLALEAALAAAAFLVPPEPGGWWFLFVVAVEPLLAAPAAIAVVLLVLGRPSARIWTAVAFGLFAVMWFAAIGLANDAFAFIFVHNFALVDEGALKAFSYGVAPALMAVNGYALYLALKSSSALSTAASVEKFASALVERRR